MYLPLGYYYRTVAKCFVWLILTNFFESVALGVVFAFTARLLIRFYSLVGEAALLEQPTERETIPIKSLVLYGMLIVYSTHARQVQVLEDSYKLLR